MTGYYEWQEALEDGKRVKNPSYDHAPGDELLLIAGLLASIRTGARRENGRDAGAAFLTNRDSPRAGCGARADRGSRADRGLSLSSSSPRRAPRPRPGSP